MLIQKRHAATYILAIALGALVPGCLPNENCADTATCPFESIDASTDGSVPTADSSLVATDASTQTPVSSDALTPTSDRLAPADAFASEANLVAADAPTTAACSPGTKRCGDQCVATDDPTFGCGATTCDKSSCPDGGSGTLVCQGSACVAGACGDGKKNCGGACVATDNPTYGCALSGCDSCPKVAGATMVCQSGTCAVGACIAGMKKCGAQCVAVDDVNYGCGASTCDKATCPTVGTGTTLACQGGACVVGSCATGTKKCGAQCVAVNDPTYGCGLTTCDASSCPAPGTGTLVCSGNACVIGTCGAGTKKCGTKCVPMDRNNGCSDPAQCTTCGASESCVGTPSLCKCVPNNDACTKSGKSCGSVVNNCGQTVSCGSCSGSQACTTAGTCCTPKTCTAGVCGTVPDGCGKTLNCGVACGGAMCSGTDLVGPGTCSANGTCTTPAPMACQGHFACSGSACKTTCTTSADCQADYFCNPGDGRCHSDVVSIASGAGHDCAALKDGRVICWGDNGNGQLGIGTTADTTGQVEALGITNAIAVKAAEWSTCALTADGRVLCWGNVFPVFVYPGSPTPSPVLAGTTPLTGARNLAVGFTASCAVTQSATYCWGTQLNGSLGLDPAVSSFTTATAVPGAGAPLSIAMGQGFQVTSYGLNRICAWGENSANLVTADADVTLTYTNPQGQCFDAPGKVAEVVAGADVGCYRLTTGAVGCWGSNFSGSIGSGSTAFSVPPPGERVFGPLNATALAAGHFHACAVPAGNARSVVCWGQGDGNFVVGDSNVAVPVDLGLPAGLTIAQLGSGMHAYETCAILSDGSLTCWIGSHVTPVAASW